MSTALAAPVIPSGWIPSDNGLEGGLWDPELSQNTSILVAGVVYVIKLPIRTNQPINSLWWQQTIIGVGASNGSFTGVYSPAGLLLAQSADVGAILAGQAVMNQMPLTSAAQGIAGSFVWAAILANLVTTQPTFARGGNPIVMNGNTPASQFRAAVAATAQTSLPPSFVPSALTLAGATCHWCGWS